MICPNERKPKESFSAYKKRLAKMHRFEKLAGRYQPLLWDSSGGHTYNRAVHGNLKPRKQVPNPYF